MYSFDFQQLKLIKITHPALTHKLKIHEHEKNIYLYTFISISFFVV
jgi:hypothetical protein